MTSATGASAQPKTVRLDALTGMRWWAAFMVFLFHTRVFAPMPEPLAGIFDQGYLGVTFFFVLSGFVLTWSSTPRVRQSTFYWRRFARIWPATMAALVLAVPVFYAIGQHQSTPYFELKPLNFGILMLSVVLLQGWWRDPAIFFSGNPAAWTLTFEAFFYAVHPYVMKPLRRASARSALILAAGVLTAMFAYRAGLYLWPASWLTLVPTPVVRLPEFVFGMALAWALRSGWTPQLSPALGALSVVGTVVAVAVSVHVPALNGIAFFNNEFFTAAVGFAIVALASAQLRGRTSLFASRWQVKLGEWSFAFYLVHATVIYATLRLFGPQNFGWLNWLPMIPLLAFAILASWALHHYVERPAESRLRRWKDARDRKVTAE